jgi:hypothetical protein
MDVGSVVRMKRISWVHAIDYDNALCVLGPSHWRDDIKVGSLVCGGAYDNCQDFGLVIACVERKDKKNFYKNTDVLVIFST